jgi:hypothetical protein
VGREVDNSHSLVFVWEDAGSPLTSRDITMECGISQ